MDTQDEATSTRVLKRFETIAVRSRSDASDAFPVRLISTVITREINGVD